MQAVTAREPGVPVNIFHTAEVAPDEFYYYDLYRSKQAFEAHCRTEAYRQLIASFGELADVIDMKWLVLFGLIESEPVHYQGGRTWKNSFIWSI